MTMESIFMIVLVAFNVWTIYFYNKLLLEVANNKEEEEKPPIDPMALVGKIVGIVIGRGECHDRLSRYVSCRRSHP